LFQEIFVSFFFPGTGQPGEAMLSDLSETLKSLRVALSDLSETLKSLRAMLSDLSETKLAA
jgi:hypothetical protein